jgi:hypothetical protein
MRAPKNDQEKTATPGYTWRLMLNAPLMYWRSRQGFMFMLALFRLLCIGAVIFRFELEGSLRVLIFSWFGILYLILSVVLLFIVFFHPRYIKIDSLWVYGGIVLADIVAINGCLYLSGNYTSEIFLLLLLPLILVAYYFPRGVSVLLSLGIICSYIITLALIQNVTSLEELVASKIIFLWISRSLFLLSAAWVYRIQGNFPRINETRIISPEKARNKLEGMLEDFQHSVVQMLYRDRLQIVACRGFSNFKEIYQIEFPASDTRYPNHLVMRSKHRQVADPQRFPSFREARYHAEHIRSWLGVPLISPTTGECFGMISIDSTIPNAFGRWAGLRATWFAMQVSTYLVEVALGPAALTQATKRDDLLDTLKIWAEQFRPKNTVDWEDDLHAARELVRCGKDIFHVEDCSVFFLRHKYNAEGERIRVLHLVASSAIPAEIYGRNEIKVTGHHGHGLTGMSVNRNRTINYGADQIERSPFRGGFKDHLQYLFSKRSRQTLIVPLRDSRGKPIGAIKIENRIGWPTENPFFPVEQHIFEVFAAMSGLMIENIRLRNFANRQAQSVHNLRAIIHRYALSPIDEVLPVGPIKNSQVVSMDAQVLRSVRTTVNYTKMGLDSILTDTVENLLLETEGLIPAIRQFVEALKAMMPQNDACSRIIFDIQDVRDNLPFRVRVGFYNVARESIINMARHSGIQIRTDGYCKLSFHQVDGTYHLSVEDNGIGFSVGRQLKHSHSFGLRDMDYQKEAIRKHCKDADIQIDSASRTGTRIHLWATL